MYSCKSWKVDELSHQATLQPHVAFTIDLSIGNGDTGAAGGLTIIGQKDNACVWIQSKTAIVKIEKDSLRQDHGFLIIREIFSYMQVQLETRPGENQNRPQFRNVKDFFTTH